MALTMAFYCRCEPAETCSPSALWTCYERGRKLACPDNDDLDAGLRLCEGFLRCHNHLGEAPTLLILCELLLDCGVLRMANGMMDAGVLLGDWGEEQLGPGFMAES